MYKTISNLNDSYTSNPYFLELKGDIEYYGLVSAVNYEKAYKYYCHSMKRGSIISGIKLARMHRYGIYVKENKKKYVKIIDSLINDVNNNLNESTCYIKGMTNLYYEKSLILNEEGKYKEAEIYAEKSLIYLGKEMLELEEVDDIEKIVQNYYKYNKINYGDLTILDLPILLQKNNKILIFLDGKKYIIELIEKDKKYLKFNGKVYKDYISLLNHATIGNRYLKSLIYEIDNIEILEEEVDE